MDSKDCMIAVCAQENFAITAWRKDINISCSFKREEKKKMKTTEYDRKGRKITTYTYSKRLRGKGIKITEYTFKQRR